MRFFVKTHVYIWNCSGIVPGRLRDHSGGRPRAVFGSFLTGCGCWWSSVITPAAAVRAAAAAGAAAVPAGVPWIVPGGAAAVRASGLRFRGSGGFRGSVRGSAVPRRGGVPSAVGPGFRAPVGWFLGSGWSGLAAVPAVPPERIYIFHKMCAFQLKHTYINERCKTKH